MGNGMEQGEARRRARELGGIAVSARPSSTPGKWTIGGWPSEKDVWIVVSIDKKRVLDDGGAGAPAAIERPLDKGAYETLDRFVRLGGTGTATLVYKRSSALLQDLLTQGYLEGTASELRITDSGRAAHAAHEPEEEEDVFEEESNPDPGDFDGGYGAGSYYQHAMNKDD
jgi:hypothetical protein